jgi:hypothetical protein
LDNQIRSTSFRAPVNNAARIFSSWVDRSKSFRTTSRAAVLTQERSKVCPSFTFTPGVHQCPAPTAPRFVVGGRGRADNHPDGVSSILVADLKEFGDDYSRLFLPVLFASVDYTARIRQPDSRRTRTGFLKRSISAPAFSSRQLFFVAAGLMSMEFPILSPAWVKKVA